MTKAITTCRYLLGLIFFVFGLNGFLNFITPPPMNDQATAFLMALVQTGYLFPLVKAIEIVGGALLLSGRYIPLAIVILAPIVVNIFFFHLVLALSPDGLLGLILPFMLALVAWGYRSYFKSLLIKDAKIELA